MTTTHTTHTTTWEIAVLDGGPAHGWRLEVADRPRVVQVTSPCRVRGAPDGVRAEGVYVYRIDHTVTVEPLRYGYDVASP